MRYEICRVTRDGKKIIEAVASYMADAMTKRNLLRQKHMNIVIHDAVMDKWYK